MPVRMTNGRHPVVMFLLVFSAISSVTNLVTFPQSYNTVVREFPAPLAITYYVLLLIGCVSVLVGLWKPGIGPAHLESAGWWLLAGQFLAYAVLVLALAGLAAALFAGLLLGMSVGAYLRTRQIAKDIKQVIGAAAHTGSLDQID